MKKRRDSFFGLHCDYHAQPSYGIQGATLCENEIRNILSVIKPDFIQIDCKGHPGWASYPSEVGNAMPKFKHDTMALWRKVTKEEGVALYTHYSGVYDIKYCSEHPNQNVMLADGTYSHGTTRTDGRYVDEILIPQLCELAEKYGVDGAWVDGECWNINADFRKESLEKFERETGIDLNGCIPAKEGDSYYNEYREFHRELFRRYIRHYTEAIHKKHPDFQITSNWAFSDYMPERVSADVDFLSGDLNPYNSLNSARYAARALAQQGKHWDLMSWNFRVEAGGSGACVPKHPIQLMQEAAAVISLGGGYQNYVTQHRDGAPRTHELLNLKELAAFLRAREPYCFHVKPIREAALLLSTYDRHREAKVSLYSREGYEKIMGMTALLCDVGQSLDIICEHTLEKEASSYRMIVIPELYCGLDICTVRTLLDYAKSGGNLVLTGKNTCRFFADNGAPFLFVDTEEYLPEGQQAYDNGGKSDGARALKPYYFTANNRYFGSLFSPCEINSGIGEAVACFSEDPREVGRPLATVIPYGKGKICAIGFDMGSQYLTEEQYTHRDLIRKAVDGLYTPTVKIESICGRLEVTVTKKNGELLIQLLNTAGSHSNPTVSTDDTIPPAVDIILSIALDQIPKRLVLQPEGIELEFEYKDGRAQTRIDRINIHSVLQVIK